MEPYRIRIVVEQGDEVVWQKQSVVFEDLDSATWAAGRAVALVDQLSRPPSTEANNAP